MDGDFVGEDFRDLSVYVSDGEVVLVPVGFSFGSSSLAHLLGGIGSSISNEDHLVHLALLVNRLQEHLHCLIPLPSLWPLPAQKGPQVHRSTLKGSGLQKLIEGAAVVSVDCYFDLDCAFNLLLL